MAPTVQDDVRIPEQYEAPAKAVYTDEVDFLDEMVADTRALLERVQAETRDAIARESRVSRRLATLKERRRLLFESMDRAFPAD